MHTGATHNFLSSLSLSRQPAFGGGAVFQPPGVGASRCWCCRPKSAQPAPAPPAQAQAPSQPQAQPQPQKADAL